MFTDTHSHNGTFPLSGDWLYVSCMLSELATLAWMGGDYWSSRKARGYGHCRVLEICLRLKYTHDHLRIILALLVYVVCEGGVFRFNRCFLNGDSAGLGDPGCSRENFGPFKSLPILMASGASSGSSSSFLLESLASCVAAITMYSLPMWNIIAAFTTIFVALLSQSMNAANLVLLVGWFENNMSNLLTIFHMTWSNQLIDPLHPVIALGLQRHLM